jgi:hypothetical protein
VVGGPCAAPPVGCWPRTVSKSIPHWAGEEVMTMSVARLLEAARRLSGLIDQSVLACTRRWCARGRAAWAPLISKQVAA